VDSPILGRDPVFCRADCLLASLGFGILCKGCGEWIKIDLNQKQIIVSPLSFNHAPDMLRGAVPSERRQRDEGVAMSVTWMEIIGIVGPAILIFMLDNSVWHK
jgi:hypothetical protein